MPPSLFGMGKLGGFPRRISNFSSNPGRKHGGIALAEGLHISIKTATHSDAKTAGDANGEIGLTKVAS